jgi:hypothetical protein
MFKKIAILVALMLPAACGGAGSSNSTALQADKPMTVGAFMTEYKKSKEETVKKYTGKPLTIGGVATTAPIMPTGATDDGILVIGERGGDPMMTMTCIFDPADKAAFSGIKADQAVILKGTFDDSSSTALKSCKVVRSE